MHIAVPRLARTLWVLSILLVSGCSVFEARKDPLAEYEAEPDSKDFSYESLKETVLEMTGNAPDPELARQHFDEAQASYSEAVRLTERRSDASQSQYLAAAEEYEQAAKRWPDSALEEEALYRLGECAFFGDQYPRAEEAYGRLIKKYPHTRYLDLVQARRFEIAQYWLQLHAQDPQPFYAVNVSDKSQPMRDSFGNAMRIFDRIRLDDPTGKLADDATLALGNAYFATGKFIRADEYYTDLRKTFPSSEHQFRTHFLGLKAKLESYQGLEYSGKPLTEAEKLLKQIRRQFPVQAEAEHEYLARAAAEIRFRQAERIWHRASRHDHRAEYGASRIYYNTIVRDYDDTPFASRAVERLREIGDRPDVPPQRLSWLVSIFPERETVKPLIATGSSGTRR